MTLEEQLQSLIPYLEFLHCSTKAVTDAVESLRNLQRENSELRAELSGLFPYLESHHHSTERLRKLVRREGK